jgi:hypothetical protein
MGKFDFPCEQKRAEERAFTLCLGAMKRRKIKIADVCHEQSKSTVIFKP